MRLGSSAAPVTSLNWESRAGFRRDLVSPVILSTSDAVTRPRSWSFWSTSSILFIPTLALKKRSPALIGSFATSDSISVMSWARGVMTSATFLDR